MARGPRPKRARGGSAPIKAKKTGPWAAVGDFLPWMRKNARAIGRAAVSRDARFAAKQLKRAIKTEGKSVGEKWPPLAESTRAGGRKKPLQDTKTLLKSIKVKRFGARTFVGVDGSVRYPDGTSVATVAGTHEGGKVIIIPLTNKMRRAIFAKMRRRGSFKGGGGPGGGGVMVIKIPARPFIKPTIDKFYGSKARATLRLARAYLGEAKKRGAHKFRGVMFS